MILAFDVGNTETTLGLFDNGNLLDHWRIAPRQDHTVDELGLLVRSLVRESGYDPAEITATIIASVVPPLTPSLIEMSERHLGVPARLLDAHSRLPVRLEVEEPLSVGADRIANTIAVATRFRTDTIAVDLGTATTFDCITGDGAFIGGIIAPGVQRGADTLVRRTAKLPRVDLEPPPAVIGRRTETALQSGIFYTAVETIDGIVQRIKTEWDRPEILVVATGGLATLLAPHCRTVDRVEPFLTLYGREIAFRQTEGRAREVRRAALKAPRGGRRR
jgi:type III pantothenate kinase